MSKPYPGMGRYVVVMNYGDFVSAYMGANTRERALQHARSLTRNNPTWVGKLGLVDQEIAAEPTWEKTDPTIYEASNGWSIERPIGGRSPYLVVDPDGRERDDQATLKAAKAAANSIRLADLGWTRMADTYAEPVR